MTLDKIKENIVKDWSVLFDRYPDLVKVPVMCWGRFYKYECSGEPYETYGEESPYDLARIHEVDGFDMSLLKKIGEECKEEFWNCDICEYIPDRRDVAYHYGDDRGGSCLYLEKKNGEFLIDVTPCDSGE